MLDCIAQGAEIVDGVTRSAVNTIAERYPESICCQQATTTASSAYNNMASSTSVAGAKTDLRACSSGTQIQTDAMTIRQGIIGSP